MRLSNLMGPTLAALQVSPESQDWSVPCLLQLSKIHGPLPSLVFGTDTVQSALFDAWTLLHYLRRRSPGKRERERERETEETQEIRCRPRFKPEGGGESQAGVGLTSSAGILFARPTPTSSPLSRGARRARVRPTRTSTLSSGL